MPYINHANSSSLNTAAGVRPRNNINHSLTLSTLDARPHFPQQKELQSTIAKFNQSFSADVGGEREREKKITQ